MRIVYINLTRKKNISMSDYHLTLITEPLKKYLKSQEYNTGTSSAILCVSRKDIFQRCTAVIKQKDKIQ
jgi:hypothetical protein